MNPCEFNYRAPALSIALCIYSVTCPDLENWLLFSKAICTYLCSYQFPDLLTHLCKARTLCANEIKNCGQRDICTSVAVTRYMYQCGFPGCSVVKESDCQCRRHGFNPWVGRSPGEGNGNPLQFSCLENPMDRRAWRATDHGVAQTQT